MVNAAMPLVPSQNLRNPILLLLPLLFSSQLPSLRIPPFTPRQLIYSKHDFLPFLLAPWAWPRGGGPVISRLIQTGLLNQIPGSVTWYYALWIVIGLARALSGFLLSRSVGWAHPSLFRHYALYETVGGLGPALVAYIAITSGAPAWAEWIMARCGAGKYTLEDRGMFVVIGLCAILCWLDGAPWTYTMAMICVLGLSVLLDIKSRVTRSPSQHYHPMDLHPHSLPSPHPDSEKAQFHPPRLRIAFQTTVLSLFIISLPYLLLSVFSSKSAQYLTMPLSPHQPSPLLDILILSHPRPGDVKFSGISSVEPSSILYSTISSYLPFLPSSLNSTRISVFTHTLPHPSFTHAREWFYPSSSSSPRHTNIPIEFYVDEDTHVDSKAGQYLHLAEALRWASEGRKHEAAEWVLLVEDDFALCGEWGWMGVVGVMKKLEKGRRSESVLDRLGGFVGTGGSGLIIHRTLLPILSLILRTHASLNSPLPPYAHPRPADIIIQDCLLGLDPLCPQSLSTDTDKNGRINDKIETGGGPLVITSELVMEHIGSRASTTAGRVYEDGKWACGWRHPFHGREEVDVVVV